MKKSEMYHLSQIAVVQSPNIAPENKISILRQLFEDEALALYFEESTGQAVEK